jgi:hypothetical protein
VGSFLSASRVCRLEAFPIMVTAARMCEERMRYANTINPIRRVWPILVHADSRTCFRFFRLQI